MIKLFLITCLLILTNATAFASENVMFPEGQIKISGILYRPSGKGPFPAIIALHGCGGINQQNINWSEKVVKLGFIVLLPDSFGSRNLGSQCGVIHSQARADVERVTDSLAPKIYLQTRADVKPSSISLVGWSNGGTTVLNVINRPEENSPRFARTVAFYPYCRKLAQANHYNPQVPLLLLIGNKDQEMPVFSCKTLINQAKKAHQQADIVIYPHAGHAFDTDLKEYTNPTARLDAFNRLKIFLAQ